MKGILLFLLLFACGVAAAEPLRVRYVQLDGGVSPAMADLLEDALRQARLEGDGLLLVRLDTPGGTVEAMRRMVKLMLPANPPVAVWVGPAGARASSAGVFLVAASAFAAMSPQATIGAASPVGLGGGELSPTAAAKLKNDVLSLVRGMAASRGRDVAWYEQSVDAAVSLTAAEAASRNVVEALAGSPRQVLVELAARKIVLPSGQPLVFDPDAAILVGHEAGWRHTALSWLLDPQVAYFLLLGGMAGLFFELVSPGAVFPGVFGAVCLILGLYALSVLPTSAAGLALIVLGFVLFVLEAHVVSYGLLGVSAILAVFFGSTILFRPQAGEPGLPLATILVTVAGLAAALLSVAFLVARAQTRRPALGDMVGLLAQVRAWSGTSGQVLVRGELWAARSSVPLAVGAEVRVVRADGLTLFVEPPTG